MKLTLFIENHQIIKKDKILTKESRRLAAFFTMFYQRKVDLNAIRSNHKMITAQMGKKFDDNKKILAALLSLNENSAELLLQIKSIYDLMVGYGFYIDSAYIGVACYLIAAGTKTEHYADTVERAREFYNKMKANNHLHIDETDYPYAALFALSGISAENGIRRIEQLYRQLRAELKTKLDRNIQQLAMTLIVKEFAFENRVYELSKEIKTSKIWRFEDGVFPVIGILTQLPIDNNRIIPELLETQSLLEKQKGFSQMFVSKHEIYFLSAMIVVSKYWDEIKKALKSKKEVFILEMMVISMTFSHLMIMNMPQHWRYAKVPRC